MHDQCHVSVGSVSAPDRRSIEICQTAKVAAKDEVFADLGEPMPREAKRRLKNGKSLSSNARPALDENALDSTLVPMAIEPKIGVKFRQEDLAFPVHDRSNWTVDFEPQDLERCEACRMINAELCASFTVVMSREGLFFVLWTENHPERGFFLEYSGDAAARWGGRFTERNGEQLSVWNALRRKLPDSKWAKQITRREALAILVEFWMPAEFRGDIALALA
jgi:hypothetical protein